MSAIRILAKGYLPNTLIKPNELQEILTQVKNMLHIANSDYSLVLDRLHLYSMTCNLLPSVLMRI